MCVGTYYVSEIFIKMLVDVKQKSGKHVLSKFEAKTVVEVIREISRKLKINENRIRLTNGSKVLVVFFS